MRDEHHRLSAAGPHPEQLCLHVEPGDFIEGAERLVHHQYLRIERQRARDRHPRLHASRKLSGIALAIILQPHQFEQLDGGAARCRLVKSAAPGAELDIAARTQPREKSVLLEYHALAAAGTGHALAVDAHLT